MREPERARRRAAAAILALWAAARVAANLVEINLATVEGDNRVERAGGLVRSAENAARGRPRGSERDRHRREPPRGGAAGRRGGPLGGAQDSRRRPRRGHRPRRRGLAAQVYEPRAQARRVGDGLPLCLEQLAADVEEADALALVGKLNADPRVSGILILRPLPPQVPEEHLYEQLDPLKDVEAVLPENAGLLALGEPRYTPSTPASVFWLLDRYVEQSGRDPRPSTTASTSCSGRSNVGKPGALAGLAEGQR